MMPRVNADVALLGHCGLYCGACRGYLRGKCPGCHANVKARWCKVRTCCQHRSYATCADCVTYTDPRDCGFFHNLFSRIVGFVLRSDRRACIMRIREIGVGAFAEEMAAKGAQTIRRGAVRSEE